MFECGCSGSSSGDSHCCSSLLTVAVSCWRCAGNESTCCAGVDGSERIAEVAKRLVAANKLAAEQGGAISVVQGRLEHLAQLPVDKAGCCTTRHVICALSRCSV